MAPNDQFPNSMRVTELAEMLNRSSEAILAYARQRGFRARNLLSSLTAAEARQIADDVKNEHHEVRIGTTILRRRKFDDEGRPLPVPVAKEPPPPPPVPVETPPPKPRRKPGRKPEAASASASRSVGPQPAVTVPVPQPEPRIERSQPMTTRLVELTADIVASQASAVPMSLEEIQQAICTVYNSLFHIAQAEEAGGPCCCECGEESAPKSADTDAAPAAAFRNPLDSIQNDKVICLECGAGFTMLTGRHLKLHGLTGKEYKRKHGLKLGTKLVAKNASAKRSEAAQARGASKGLLAYQAKRRTEKQG